MSSGAAQRMLEHRRAGTEQCADDRVQARGFAFEAEASGDALGVITDSVQGLGAANCDNALEPCFDRRLAQGAPRPWRPARRRQVLEECPGF